MSEDAKRDLIIVGEDERGLIVVPGDEATGPPLTLVRVAENRLITEEAEAGLRLPPGTTMVARPDGLGEMQFGVVETPLGYVVVDHEGGHLKLPQEKDDRVTLLVWGRATRRPLAENPVTVGHILEHYCRQTMPLADFISNRDGMEAQWRKLVTTLVACGVNVEADAARRERNLLGRIITGGSLPMDLNKM